MTKVLLTGATGFIGSYICRYLVSEGFHVIATKRSTSRLELISEAIEKIQLVDIDLEDLTTLDDLVANTDIVIHCAALLSITTDSNKEMFDFNIGRTSDLVNLALKHQIRKFIFISSVASLNDLNNGLTSEKDTGSTNEINTKYGISKLLAEREVFRGKAEGMDIIILHPSFVIGAGFWKTGTPSFVDKIFTGIPFYPPGSNGTVDVRDVAIAVRRSIDYSGEYDSFVISAENHSLKSVFDMTCDALGIGRIKSEMTPFLGRTGILFDKIRSVFTGSKRLITVDTLRTSSGQFMYDNRRSVKELSMEYRQIKETIDEVCIKFLESKQTNEDFGILEF
ncbi:MAG: SDR family NAD(P)-dependent oxidoreductase [Saprospiraceae bacterium]|nr:SDR family NAD(P)-dependent oxidoreductase [Bacteroidia bacterium]NNK90441.1 SDR family NAD(P)-dependent oxidoreductase [Saprospiraceae bacterium]